MVPGDPTPPVVTPHFFGTQGLNGWWVTNVTLNWTIEDPESPILETRGCDAVTLTQDTAGTSFTCYARSDGGETQVTVTIRLDKTGPVVTATPSRSPDSNGWYNHALSVGFSGTDATSGMDSCVSPQSYSGPDNVNASVSGSCRDRAGNVTVKNFSLSYDATAPQVTGANASRSPDRNGWYNHTLSVTFAGTDATSGIDSCTQTSYSGPDSANASVSGVCRDVAGNTSSSSNFGFQYDETGPAVTATPSRSPDANGWYNHPLTVGFSGTDATSGVDTCSAPQNYSGPDNANASVNGSCTDRAGNSTQRTFGLSYDSTAPQVTGSSPSRSPDSNGWYNHAFTVTFAGSRRHVRHRHVHADDVLGARRRDGHHQRHLPRPRREHEREQRLQLPVRRHRPRRDCDSGSCSRFERLVQPCAVGQLRGHGCDLGDGLVRAAAELLGARLAERLGFRFVP